MARGHYTLSRSLDSPSSRISPASRALARDSAISLSVRKSVFSFLLFSARYTAHHSSLHSFSLRLDRRVVRRNFILSFYPLNVSPVDRADHDATTTTGAGARICAIAIVAQRARFGTDTHAHVARLIKWRLEKKKKNARRLYVSMISHTIQL